MDSRPFGPAEPNVSCSFDDDVDAVDEVVEMLSSLADEEEGNEAVETLSRRCRRLLEIQKDGEVASHQVLGEIGSWIVV